MTSVPAEADAVNLSLEKLIEPRASSKICVELAAKEEFQIRCSASVALLVLSVGKA